MARFGLCGGFYTSQNVAADAQACMNFYPELNESGDGKAAKVLNLTPGLLAFATLPGSALATYNANGRLFAACSDGNLYEVFSDGTFSNRASIPGWSSPAIVSICGSAIQLLIVNGQRAFCYTLATNAIVDITRTISKPLPIIGQYVDGYFVILFGNSQFFQLSALMDGTTWSGLDTYQMEVYPDNILSMLIDHREAWFWGLKATQVYYNSGAASNPETPIVGAFIEQGIVAPASPVKLDNSVFWIGGDERGSGIAWRANGYSPVRVSTHAIENAWQSYPTIADAIGYTYQKNGHNFWQIYFPTANVTWCYDAATGIWHQRGFWNQVTGAYDAHHSRNHVFCFGKHLVGDWSSGNIYELSETTYTDNGSILRRMRRAPYIGSPGVWVYHNSLEIDGTMGCGLQAGQGSDPQITLKWSDDRNRTWSNDHILSVGKVGQYGLRAILRRLGRNWGSAARVYEMSYTDPVPFMVTDAYIEATPAFGPSERLTKQLEKIA